MKKLNSFCIFGKKIGMITLFDKKNKYTPITLIKVFYSYILNFKININKNYNFVRILLSNDKFYNFNFIFNNILNGYLLNYKKINEFKINNFLKNKLNKINIIPYNLFYINQYIKISSYSIGKGFSGVIKKYNFKSNRATHGNSKSHNKLGSIGMCQDPGKVFLGKKMPSRMGFDKVSIKNLIIYKIDFNQNIFYIKGSVPGKNNLVSIQPSY